VKEVLRAYGAVWSERDPAARMALLEQCLVEDAEVIDPDYRLCGRQAVSDDVERFHRETPSFRAALKSGFDAHDGWVRFAVAVLDGDGKVVREGLDVVELADDGRIARVITFWGDLPPVPRDARQSRSADRESDPYLLGYRQSEQERLERQAQELAHESEWLFDRIGVGDGWRVVEIGCGPRGCLGLLAARVGAAGRVVGVERSAEQVERARHFVAERQLTNVEALHGDARGTDLPAGSFDLATARLVLVNVPQPEQIVAEMARLVRPGGFVALHEADSTAQRCDPPHQAQTRLLEILHVYAERNGIDRAIGVRVPRLLREAGLIDVTVNPLIHAYPATHSRRLLALEFVENARTGILDDGLIEEAELDELTTALRHHLRDPDTLVVSSLFIQAWGRKPER
jgi:SAM-dependent methyltransferase